MSSAKRKKSLDAINRARVNAVIAMMVSVAATILGVIDLFNQEFSQTLIVLLGCGALFIAQTLFAQCEIEAYERNISIMKRRSKRFQNRVKGKSRWDERLDKIAADFQKKFTRCQTEKESAIDQIKGEEEARVEEFKRKMENHRKQLILDQEQEIEKVERTVNKKGIESADALHDFIHDCRDAVNRLVTLSCEIRSQHGVKEVSGTLFVKEFEACLSKVLDRLVLVFEPICDVCEKKMWVAMRRFNSEGNYATFIRTVGCSPERGTTTKDLPPSTLEIWNLIQLYGQRHAVRASEKVLITGSNCSNWDPEKPNNAYKEDQSVMMAPVMIHRNIVVRDDLHDRIDTISYMPFILFINAHDTGVFDDGHRGTMKCAADVLSILANTFVREIRDFDSLAHYGFSNLPPVLNQWKEFGCWPCNSNVI